MNSNIQIFSSQDFTVRTYTDENGKVWFVGRDVAEGLQYQRPADAVAAHVDEEDKGVGKIPTPGGLQNMTVINESGVFSLIFESKLPIAKKYKHWVTSEVLPQIHKTGSYSINDSKPVVAEETKKAALPAHSGSIKAGERLAVKVFKCKSEEDFQTVIAMDEDFCDAFGYSWLDRHGFKLRSKIVPAPQGELSRYAVSFEQSYTTKSFFWEHDYDLSKIAAKNNDDDNNTVNFDEWSY